MPSEAPVSYQPILMTLIAVAFSAWAGVIVWFGNAINERLGHLQTSMERVENEMGEFKLTVSERVTRVETKVEQAHRQ
jgi:hypothetical protein